MKAMMMILKHEKYRLSVVQLHRSLELYWSSCDANANANAGVGGSYNTVLVVGPPIASMRSRVSTDMILLQCSSYC